MLIRNPRNTRLQRRTSGAVTRRASLRQPAPPVDPTPNLSSREVKLLAKIARAFGSSAPTTDLLHSVAPAFARLVSYDRMFIFLARSSTGMMELVFQTGLHVPGSPTGYIGVSHGSIFSHVMKTREPWMSSRIDATTAERFPAARPSIEAGIKSWLAVPLLAGDSCIGTLHLQSLSPDAYGPRHAWLAQMASVHLANGLYSRAEAEKMQLEAHLAQTMVEERTAVAELGQIIHSSPHLGEVYGPFTEKLRQLVPWDGISIVIRKDNGHEWELRLDEGLTVPSRRLTSGATGDQSLSSWVLEQQRPQILSMQTPSEVEETVARFPSLQAWVDLGLKSLLCVPLIIRDRAVGAMHLRSLQAGAYSEQNVALIEQIALYVASAVNNASMTRRETEQARMRAAVAEIGNTVISSLDIKEVYPLFAELVRRIIPWDRIIVNALRSDDTSYKELYWAGLAVQGRQPGDVVQMPGTFTEHAIQERRPVALDLRDEAGMAAAKKRFPGLRQEIESGLRSFLTAPLFSIEGIIGTFSVRSLQSGAYTSEHVQLMQQVSTHLATAMVNAQLHARLAKEAEEKAHIAHLGRVLSSDSNLNNVLPEFFDVLRRMLPADRMVITVVDPGTGAHEDKHIVGKAIPQWDELRHSALKTMLVQQVIDHGKGRLVPTAEFAAATLEEHLGLARSYAAGLKSAIFAPLIAGGKVIGTLNLKSEKEDAYTPSDLDLLERVAQQVAGNVQLAENFEQTLAAASDRERRVLAEAERANLERQAQEKSRFITQVGHELRTPLTTVLAFADILRRNRTHNLSQDQLDKLVVMQRNGRRLATLIDDLLDLSRIEQGSYILQMQPLDLSAFARRFATDARPAIALRGQKLKLKVPRRPVTANADQQRLAQVLSSLITNASNYSPEGSTITLSVSARGDMAEIAVSDEGIGISEKEQARIFNLFYRVDNEATRSVPGTGIGLYVAKTLIEAHGGKIAVDSSYKSGARFVITLSLDELALKDNSADAA